MSILTWILRIAIIIISTPVWLLAGFFILAVSIPLGVAVWLAMLIEWAFTGGEDPR